MYFLLALDQVLIQLVQFVDRLLIALRTETNDRVTKPTVVLGQPLVDQVAAAFVAGEAIVAETQLFGEKRAAGLAVRIRLAGIR